ncbi:MAG: ABC transporter ATP-binding protein [Synergistaceae bacterium]|nr:ABC transporter ATP-binding protein [Synergistaceae bacterium]
MLKDMSSGPEGLSQGRLVALIGPNGSGKTTLLRTLCGLLRYDGSVTLYGRELGTYRRRELGRIVGMLPQTSGADIAYSVHDLIGLGRIPHGGLVSGRSEDDEAAVLNAARVMGVEPLLFRQASKLSGGEMRRVLMAMLLAQDPAVFLLDEPSSASDIKHAVRMFSIMKDLSSSGKLVVSAVHDINLAARFADALVVIKEGRILDIVPGGGLDEDILSRLYDVSFELFMSSGGEKAWHAIAE